MSRADHAQYTSTARQCAATVPANRINASRKALQTIQSSLREICGLGHSLCRLRGAHSHLAKVGIQGVDSDLAMLVRTAILIVALSLFDWFAGKWSNAFALPSLA